MEQALEAIEEAVTAVALSIDPYQDLDGAALTLENVLQRLFHLWPLLHGSDNYTAAVDHVRTMIEELKAIQDDKG